MCKKIFSRVFAVMSAAVVFCTALTVVPLSAEENPETKASSDKGATNGHVVCLDPGHQSYDIDMSASEPNGPGSSEMKAKATSGTQGIYTGIPEFALNLDVSLMLRDILEKRGYKVIMTRTDNETAISNSERAALAGNEGAEIFVRIHANGEESHQNSGAMALCPSGSNPYVASLSAESERLSSCILNAYCERTGFGNLGVQYSDTMTGINWSTVPVTILEMGFMTNESDDTRMANVEFRQIMAEGIADGIDAYFGIDTSVYEEAEEELSGNSEDATLSENKPDAALSGTKAKTESSGTEPLEAIPEPQPDAAMRKLLPMIQEKLPKDDGQWAVYVGNMANGAACCMNSRQMQAASLIKLYIMGAVYENYKEITDAHGKEEVDELLKAMITVSDNDAANTLTTYLGDGNEDAGMKAVTEYCTAHGYRDSHMGRLLLHSNEFDDNYTSVKDCGLFLTRVYNNTLGKESEKAADKTPEKASDKESGETKTPDKTSDKTSGETKTPDKTSDKTSGKTKTQDNASDMPGAEEMFSLLSQQTRTNKIPSQLPVGVRVANKTGELGDVENDAGIIYETAGGVDLVVCFMSEGLKSPGNAQTAIGEISKLVYSYYNE